MTKPTRLKVFSALIVFTVFAAFFSPLLEKAKAGELPAELENLQIKDGFVASQSKEVGLIRIIKGNGKLIVVHRAKQDAYHAREGNPVYENDSLYTLDCRCRIEFEDMNVIIMAPETHLDIDEVSTSFFAGKKESLFGMTKGKAVIYALRLFGYRDIKLRLKTPHAMIGVRGTKFGAEIEKKKKKNTKDDLLTRAYVFEGEVDVTSIIDGRLQPLHKNEILEADQRGLGEVKFDPAKTKSFLESIISGMEPKKSPHVADEKEPDGIRKWGELPGPGMGIGPGHRGMGGHRH
ncbi:MAG: FecR domain-containing protein [Deltaproteobacteria bacterium]|nr:FecR domain-containing protein [Deltaproteobacteria bacterium]MBW1737579.1 FecR domain-containing protein [Deltaproteobacteria bacterium]MBW2034677.1 FecR domain-containing protein [Deltaproteobacteria bacterium]MBW2357672.1 FecR domain-containing protein [Deltaproteobacteria bacterium]